MPAISHPSQKGTPNENDGNTQTLESPIGGPNASQDELQQHAEVSQPAITITNPTIASQLSPMPTLPPIPIPTTEGWPGSLPVPTLPPSAGGPGTSNLNVVSFIVPIVLFSVGVVIMMGLYLCLQRRVRKLEHSVEAQDTSHGRRSSPRPRRRRHSRSHSRRRSRSRSRSGHRGGHGGHGGGMSLAGHGARGAHGVQGDSIELSMLTSTGAAGGPVTRGGAAGGN
ncbi:hypothetical protein F4776DRAFT_674959 [Hypoxylon sp. NC0597]|nr:hypothetical protein F4776DRAFT_674959 [Hypoxylon sp. NC0597]